MTEMKKLLDETAELDLETVTGGNDPETMSEEDLLELISFYRRMIYQARESSHISFRDPSGTMDACSRAVDELLAVYNRRFNADKH